MIKFNNQLQRNVGLFTILYFFKQGVIFSFSVLESALYILPVVEK